MLEIHRNAIGISQLLGRSAGKSGGETKQRKARGERRRNAKAMNHMRW